MLRLVVALAAASAALAHISSPVLFVYFRADNEQLYYAYSEDGLSFTALNHNKPVMVNTMGVKKLRDPFVNRAPDGTFHLVATNGWTSDSILHWSSKDLVSWTNGELAPVMTSVKGTKEAWAPEWIYSPENSSYLVFWSSETPAAEGKRIWGSWTDMAGKWSSPFVVMDVGYNSIDAGMVQVAPGKYEIFFKDERGENVKETPYKAARRVQSLASTPAGPLWSDPSELLTDHLTEGFELLHLPGNPTGNDWLLYYDCFTSGHFSVSSSPNRQKWTQVPGCSCTNYGGGVLFPDSARHGSFMQISKAELQLLKTKFP